MTEDPTNKIHRQNVSDLAESKIRSWILLLELPPKERLIVDDLAKQMGVSRTPVREALRVLAEEGLVVYDGKSYIVKCFSKREVQDLLAIRRSLELLAVRQAAERANSDIMVEMRALLDKYDPHAVSEDIELFISSDICFHELICEASGNTRLHRMLIRLNEQSWWLSRMYLSLQSSNYAKQTILASFGAHCQILQCLEERDPERAAVEMEKHLLAGEESKIDKLFAQESLDTRLVSISTGGLAEK